MAVSTLSEERNISDLREAINELSESFNTIQNITVNFHIDNEMETLSPDIKLCLYKTIRESITNGIKHGRATVFDINISMYNYSSTF